MTSKSVYQKVLAFYKLLYATVIESKKLNEEDAKILESSFIELKSDLSLSECTVNSLREVHEEYHDDNSDLDRTTELSKCVFADLASHLKDPECDELIQQFVDVSGTSDSTDLYVQVANIRRLCSSDPDTGPAVVTLVVQRLDGLLDLLENGKDARTEYCHFSHARKLAAETTASGE